MKWLREQRANDACSLLDESVSMNGDLQFVGTLRVAGHITGSITTADRLIVEPEAHVEAHVRAGEVTIYGKVTGDVVGERRVEVCEGAVLVGDVESPHLVLDEGARFEGRSHQSAPESKQSGAAISGDDDEVDESSVEVQTG